MKLLILGICVLFSISSFAYITGPLENTVAATQLTEKKSYYERLGEMFHNGSVPETSKLLGVLWSGRCFKSWEPYTPRNAALHFRRKPNRDVGPIGDNVVFYEVVSVWFKNRSPSYFDDKDVSIFYGMNSFYSDIFESDNSILTRLPLVEPAMSKIRVSGKYLIEEISHEVLNEVYTVGIRCYYFIPGYTH